MRQAAQRDGSNKLSRTISGLFEGSMLSSVDRELLENFGHDGMGFLSLSACDFEIPSFHDPPLLPWRKTSGVLISQTVPTRVHATAAS